MAENKTPIPIINLENTFDGFDKSLLGGFTKELRSSIYDITQAVNIGKYDSTFVESGLQFPMGRSGTASVNHTASKQLHAKVSTIVTQQPVANVIVKKRVFANLKNMASIRHLDSLEKSILRVTKRLFQLKAYQIASYESLVKFEKVLQKEQKLHIPYLWNAINNAVGFGAISETEQNVLNEALFKIFKRNLASEDTNLTTWYIDQFNKDLENVGQGVGVMEFTTFTNITSSNKLSSDGGNGTVSFEDPYHMMMISDDDIELAVANAIYDRTQDIITQNILVNTLAENLRSAAGSSDPALQAQARAALAGSNNIALETARAGRFDSPEEVSLIRARLRKLYLGRSVIQPTDSIYFYIKSNTIFEEDNESVGPSLGLDKQGIDEGILRQEMADVLGGATDTEADIDLYRSLRNNDAFTGACVFSGVVQSVSDSFNDGSYQLKVSAENNMWYLKRSQVNTDPSLDQKATGPLYENLTPFKLEFDAAGNPKSDPKKLLDENIELLKHLSLKYISGPKRGINASVANIVSGIAPGTNIEQIEHFPGMTYRFKEGLAAVGSPFSVSGYAELAQNVYGQSLLSTPFDTMDSANIISLMVTGKPYNPITFLNNIESPDGRLDTLMRALDEQNKTLGAFKQVKDSHATFFNLKLLAQKMRNLKNTDTKIGQLQNLKIEAQQRLDGLYQVEKGALTDTNNNVLQKTIDGLRAQINDADQQLTVLSDAYSKLDDDFKTLTTKMDSLGFSIDPVKRNAELLDYENKQLYLSNKRIEDVRFNRDTNYLIIGSEYDADLDVQAFVGNLRNKGFSFFTSTFEDAHKTASSAAKAIDFEFFCDQSGNIVFRAPRYNKVPLSVYYEMFRRKGQDGIDIIPEFVKGMFESQLTSLRNSVIALNWEILIELGKSGSNEIINAISLLVPNNESIISFLGAYADQYSSEISLHDGDYTTEIIEFSSDKQVISNTAINKQINDSKASSEDITLSQEMLAIIIDKYNTYFQSNINSSQVEIISPNNANATKERNELFQKIRILISKRNTLVKKINAQLSTMGISPSDFSVANKLDETLQAAVDNKNNQLQQEVMQSVVSANFQGFTRPQISPEFSSMIEDDTRNYLGRGSGRRFVITDDMIKQLEITEKQPDYCKIEVNGSHNFGSNLNTMLEQKVLWAGAVDYDLWQQYGFTQGQAVSVPYLSDPETQLKPYAIFLLLKQRKRVLSGTVTVIGNEYYQLGDVIYIASRDLLFYTTGVTQSYTEGEDFVTTLTIEYGRPPGEYIPSPLDIIGKTVLKQARSALSSTKRLSSISNSYIPLASVYLPDTKYDDITRMLLIDRNFDGLINSLITANIELLTKSNAKLLLSGFKTGEITSDIDARLKAVSDWFANPTAIAEDGTKISLSQATKFEKLMSIQSKQITAQVIDIIPKAANNEQQQQNAEYEVLCSNGSVSTIEPSATTAVITPSEESIMIGGPLYISQVIEIGIWYK